MLINADKKTAVRITDLWGIIPAITGKVELVYEGEQMGSYAVAMDLVNKAIKDLFLQIFPNPDKTTKLDDRDPFGVVKAWFSGGNTVDLLNDDSEKEFQSKLDSVQGLDKLIKKYGPAKELTYFYKELILHGLAVNTN